MVLECAGEESLWEEESGDPEDLSRDENSIMCHSLGLIRLAHTNMFDSKSLQLNLTS